MAEGSVIDSVVWKPPVVEDQAAMSQTAPWCYPNRRIYDTHRFR